MVIDRPPGRSFRNRKEANKPVSTSSKTRWLPVKSPVDVMAWCLLAQHIAQHDKIPHNLHRQQLNKPSDRPIVL